MFWLILAVVLLIALAVVAVIFIFPKNSSDAPTPPKTNPKTLPELYNSTLEEQAPTTGCFISTFDLPSADRFIQTDFDIRGMSQCAPVHRKTCGALSYLRKDFYPYAFFHPTDNDPTYLGFIFDPVKIWELIQGMFVVDGATVARDAFSNEVGSAVLVAQIQPEDFDTELAIVKVLEDNNIPINREIIIFVDSKESGYGSSLCADDNCRFINAGGAFSLWMLGYLKRDQLDTTGFRLTQVQNPPLGIFRGWYKYYALTFDDTCVACKTPQVCSGQSIRDYINPTVQDNFSYTLISQCKYPKTQWSKWVESQRDLYSLFREIVKDPKNYNQQFFGKPDNLAYLENEFNMYIYPDDGDEHDQQQKIFIDSLVGIFYIDRTCEEVYESIKDIPIKGYPNIESRCKDGSPNIQDVQKKALELQKALEKYKKVPVYRASLESNGLVNKTILDRLDGEGIPFEDLFTHVV